MRPENGSLSAQVPGGEREGKSLGHEKNAFEHDILPRIS